MSITRREAIATIGLGSAGYMATAAFTAPACSAKSVGAEIVVVKSFLKVVSTEIPGQPAMITKILKVADDFNADYQRGDFVSAGTIFATLEGDITQLISDLGVNVSNRVKTALVLIDAGVTAIWELLNSQKTAAVQSEIAKQGQASRVQSLESGRAAHLDKLFTAIH